MVRYEDPRHAYTEHIFEYRRWAERDPATRRRREIAQMLDEAIARLKWLDDRT